MKKKVIWMVTIAMFAVFVAGCKKEMNSGGLGLAVSFTSTIQGQSDTRLTGNSWDSGDAIGVFMKQGSGLTNVLASNRMYTTSGDGNFSGSGAEVINYPESGSVDFIAYYPYVSTLSCCVLSLPIDVANQTDHSAIDVLYSNNATGFDRESGTANLEFTHQLTKVELTIDAGSGLDDLDGLTVAFRNVNTTAQLDLETGTISGAGIPREVQAKVTAQGASRFIETILIPGGFGSTEVVFTLPSGSFIWSLPANTDFESGKKHLYDIVLQRAGSGSEVAFVSDATIVNWVDAPASGNVELAIDPFLNPELVIGTVSGNMGIPDYAFDLIGLESYAPGSSANPGPAQAIQGQIDLAVIWLNSGGYPMFCLPSGVASGTSSAIAAWTTKNNGTLFKLNNPTADEIARFEALERWSDLVAAFELEHEEILKGERPGHSVSTNGPVSGGPLPGNTTNRINGGDVGDIFYYKSATRNMYVAFRVKSMQTATTPRTIELEVRSIFDESNPFPEEDESVVRILAIGNSFSMDATELHLRDLAKTDGVKLLIANMYISGATLQMHWNNAQNNSAAYEYRVINEDGVLLSSDDVSLHTALVDKNWDYISFQNGPISTGEYETYVEPLPALYDYVKELAPGHTKYIFHQTWAYAQNSTQAAFARFNYDQEAMYNGIVDATSRVHDLVDFDVFIPAGTAIQNGRISVVGDNFTRDGYHLNELGRYTAACTWFEAIFQQSVVGNSYRPTAISEDDVTIAQRAAHFAVDSPYAVTELED